MRITIMGRVLHYGHYYTCIGSECMCITLYNYSDGKRNHSYNKPLLTHGTGVSPKERCPHFSGQMYTSLIFEQHKLSLLHGVLIRGVCPYCMVS